MKICPPHWAKLEQAIKDRGLGHLIASPNWRAPYDPLDDSAALIKTEALRFGGPYLLRRKDDGSSYCPICEALEHGLGDESAWIDGPANTALEECRRVGLAPMMQ